MKTVIVMFVLFGVVGISNARPIPGARSLESDASSPTLTSVIRLETSAERGDVELVATGLTATGETATRTEAMDSWVEETYHRRRMTDPRDGYWTACHRILWSEGEKTYIIGYEEEDGDSDESPDDNSFSYSADVPFDFDLATQTFRIRTSELVPLPIVFRQRVWTGVRFLVPVNLQDFSKQEAEMLIRSRGGVVVAGNEAGVGPVDVVLLPDRIDFCPAQSRSRNRLAEKWIRQGARVLWERSFGRPHAPAGDGDEEWR